MKVSELPKVSYALQYTVTLHICTCRSLLIITTFSLYLDLNLPEATWPVCQEPEGVVMATALSQIGRDLFTATITSLTAAPDFEGTLRRTQASGQPWTDPDFPPDAKSLIKDWDTAPRAKAWQRYVWRRAGEFMDRRTIGVFKDIQPTDIKQGSIGNCYFLSALSVLAEHSLRITKLFITDQVNDSGVYGIYFNKNGAWVTVLIDDFFPCLGPDNGPAFSVSNESELWVLMLEKAWAKVHGCYERIEQGETKEVLRDLTGAPCVVLRTDDADAWERLLDAEAKRYLITASAGNTKSSLALMEEMGLIAQHAYAVLDVRQEVTPRGKVRLLQLRNPWGNCDWSGDWSVSSPLWTDDLRRKLNSPSSQTHGLFWISFEDFSTYFSFITICLINDNYVDSWITRTSQVGRNSFISMTVEKRSQLYISLNQIDKRTSWNTEYEYSDAKFVVAKRLENGDFKYIFGKQNVQAGERNIWEGGVFDPGSYVVLVYIDWKSRPFEFCVSSYGETAPVFEPIPDDIPGFLEKVYGNAAVSHGKMTDYSSESAPSALRFTGVLPEGYGFFHYQNGSDKALHEIVTLKKFTGLELLPPHGGARFEVTVQPFESATVVLRQKDTKGYSMSYSASVSMQPVANALEAMVKAQGVKAKRKDPASKRELDIVVHTLQHANGVCYLYENNTADRRLQETIIFRMTGLVIVGGGTDTVRLDIGPGEKKLLELRAVERVWTIQTKVAYTVL